MRPYVQSFNRDQTGKKALYQSREATEWDLGLRLHNEDIDTELQKIIFQIEVNRSRLYYALVGGIEYTIGGGFHAHIAIIFKHPQKKHAVLHMLDRLHQTNQYCVPRNQSYSYLGWKLHHIKQDTKIGQCQLYEHGILPFETLTKQQYDTCVRFGYEGPKPIKQQKIKPIKEIKPKQSKEPKPIKVKEPKQPKQIKTKQQHSAQRTEQGIIKAALRLQKYQHLLDTCEDEQEQARLQRIITDINADYFD